MGTVNSVCKIHQPRCPETIIYMVLKVDNSVCPQCVDLPDIADCKLDMMFGMLAGGDRDLNVSDSPPELLTCSFEARIRADC